MLLDLDDDALRAVLRTVTHARSSVMLARTSKRWLTLSREEQFRRAAACVTPEGLAWKPAIACEMESVDDGTFEGDWDELKKRVCDLPFVLGFTPAPCAAMWARTKPTQRGAQQVFLDESGAEIKGVYGCNESVSEYNCDSNWNRGFVWGVMALTPDKDMEVAYYEIVARPDDALDEHAIVSQFPLPFKALCGDAAFLGNKCAIYNSGLGDPINRYVLGGRLLRMSDGNSEENVMLSLGFVRNPNVAADDHANEARWCRLPSAPDFGAGGRGVPAMEARLVGEDDESEEDESEEDESEESNKNDEHVEDQA